MGLIDAVVTSAAKRRDLLDNQSLNQGLVLAIMQILLLDSLSLPAFSLVRRIRTSILRLSPSCVGKAYQIIAGNAVDIFPVAAQVAALCKVFHAYMTRKRSLASMLAEMVSQIAAFFEDRPAAWELTLVNHNGLAFFMQFNDLIPRGGESCENVRVHFILIIHAFVFMFLLVIRYVVLFSSHMSSRSLE